MLVGGDTVLVPWRFFPILSYNYHTPRRRRIRFIFHSVARFPRVESVVVVPSSIIVM